MAFPDDVKIKALLSCGRKCCICHKFCGNNMEIHHIRPRAQGGEDTFENAIPLCFDCHAEVGQYNPHHPKGTKYSEKELIGHRDNWYQKVKEERTSQKKYEPIRIYSTSDSEPNYWVNVSSGKELLSYASNLCALEFDYDEPDSASELAKLMSFSGMLEDALHEIPEMSISQKMALAFEFTDQIKELNDLGYMVFAGKSKRIVKGGILEVPDDFPIWIVYLLKKENPQIICKEYNSDETAIQAPEIPG